MAQTVMKSICILIFSLTKVFAHIDANNSDIFIAYSGHSEVGDDKPVLMSKPETETSKAPEADTNKKEDDVIFVPNEKPVVTIEDDYLVNDGVKISDVMNNRRIGDVIRDDTLVEDPTNFCRLEALERAEVTSERKQVEELQETVAQLKHDLDKRDLEALQADLEIEQIPEEKGENIVNVVTALAAKLGVTLEDRDVVFAERVGAPGTGAAATGGGQGRERPRRALVRLARRGLRDQLLRAARARRGLNTVDIGLAGPPRLANDMIFISGKNNENVEKKEGKNKHNDAKKTEKETKHIRLDCANLDCANSVQSVCGGKPDGKEWRYRLFLNECFFRKVNCAFKYPNNRYKMVALEKCRNIGSHTEGRPASQPIGMPFSNAQDDKEITITFSSRRSLNADITGLSCSHPCPVACTERYEPQCAMSPTGHRRTFLNHCQLDYHSCVNGVVWRIRPLSECVGGRKAELQQNRGFIAWMQKVGIVDNRGRLTLSKAPRT